MKPLQATWKKGVPKVNEAIPRLDVDKASLKYYSVSSLYNYEAFYNIDPSNLEEVNRAKAFIEKEKEIEKALREPINLRKNSEVMLNPVTGLLEEIAPT